MVDSETVLKCPHCGVLSSPKERREEGCLAYYTCPVCKKETMHEDGGENWITIIIEDRYG